MDFNASIRELYSPTYSLSNPSPSSSSSSSSQILAIIVFAMGASSKPLLPFFPVNEIVPTTSVTLAKILDINFRPPEVVEWEVRPGGMLVQRRDTGPTSAAALPPPIRVRIKHESDYHEISVNPQSTFGELKKLVLEEIGIRQQEQKLLFKGKVMVPTAFLDVAGVKDRSKLVLLEDPAAQAQRVLEMRRTAKEEKASKLIGQISVTVDRLAEQVSAMKSLVRMGKKVAEGDVLGLTGQLMDQLVKLDSSIHGDVMVEWGKQVRKVQKLVETLDVIKIEYSTPATDASVAPQQLGKQQPQQRHWQQLQQDENKLKPPQLPVTKKKWDWEGIEVPSMTPATSLLATVGTSAAVSFVEYD